MRGHSFLTPVAMLSPRARIVLFALLVAALVLLFVVSPRLPLQGRTDSLDIVAGSIETLSAPFRAVSRGLARIKALQGLEKRHRLLSQDYESLLFIKDYATRLEKENRELRAMLQYRVDSSTFFSKREVGRVLSRAQGSFAHNVIVNVGRRQGITLGSIVLSRGALVGIVTSIGARSARVRLLRDPQSRIAVKIAGKGQRALLSGQGTENLVLLFWQGNQQVAARSPVVTSGDAGILPPDLPVGYIKRSADNRLEVVLKVDSGVLTTVDLIAYKPLLANP